MEKVPMDNAEKMARREQRETMRAIKMGCTPCSHCRLGIWCSFYKKSLMTIDRSECWGTDCKFFKARNTTKKSKIFGKKA